MTALAFAPIHNTPNKHDADYFGRLADRWAKEHGGTVYRFDNSKPMEERRPLVINKIIAAPETLSHVAFFCHGWVDGIQAGIRRNTAAGLAANLRHHDCSLVTLFACSTADGKPGGTSGDGGFADVLRDEMCKAGLTRCRVDGHDRPGDAVYNPYVRRFDGNGTLAGANGGAWIVDPADDETFHRWSSWLHAGGWSRFSTMTVAEIHAEL